MADFLNRAVLLTNSMSSADPQAGRLGPAISRQVTGSPLGTGTAYDDDVTQAAPAGVSVLAADARFFRALGDSTRLAILQHLLVRPHNVSELTKELGVPQGRVSNHLACLRWCRFVTAERSGRQVIYSVSDLRLRGLLDLASELASDSQEHLATCGRIGPDWI